MTNAPHISLIVTSQDWLTPHLEELDQTSFHAVYVADHPSFTVTESWTWLAFAAARTKRIRLGTHVTGAPFYHPTRLAKQVASVDLLSGGRTVLGIGTAYEVQDFLPYGFAMEKFSDRVSFLEETIVILKLLFTGHIDGFDGKFHSYVGAAEFAPVPLQKPHPPIVIGLNTAGLALQVAARHADAINTWQLSPQQVADLKQPLADAAGTARRRANSVALTSDVVMARGADSHGAQELAHQIRDMARGWGRKDNVTDWGAGGVLYGDGDAMCDQIMDFAEVGVSELTVAVANLDDLHWLNSHVASRL